MCKIEPHSPIKFQIWLSNLIQNYEYTIQRVALYPLHFNSKPNFEGFKIHNFFMKIYEKWQNEFNRMLNL